MNLTQIPRDVTKAIFHYYIMKRANGSQEKKGVILKSESSYCSLKTLSLGKMHSGTLNKTNNESNLHVAV